MQNKKLIDDIVNNMAKVVPSQFGPDVNGDYINGYDDINDVINEVCSDWECHSGATKYVINPLDSDVVIKIPFNGYFWTDEDDDYEEHFEPFYNAYDGENGDNYCDADFIIYNQLVENYDIEDILVNTEYYGNIDGTTFYTQEKVVEFYDRDVAKDPSKEDVEKVKSSTTNRYIEKLPFVWLAAAFAWYGEDLVNRLLLAIDDGAVRDLHSQNIGYRLDGSPCIFDLGGYNEE